MTTRTEASIREIRAAFERGETTPRATIERCLQAVDDHAQLNAFITPPPPDVLDEAIDPEGPLGGIPIAVKDNICTRDFATTAASEMLADYHPPRDATAVCRLRKAGAVVFGKTNLDEFGMGGSTEHSHVGPTLHPLDPALSPGGSSGGSAVCVATGMSPVALGSDTGGSVRQPASFCGVVGFKPSWGRVSRRGLIAFASSLDQIGWLTNTVDDAARLFAIVAGGDRLDATCLDEPVPQVDENAAGAMELDQLRVGIPRGWIDDTELQPAVRKGFDGWRRQLEQAGAQPVDIELPHVRLATPCYQVIATAEASSNLARYDGVGYGTRAEASSTHEVYERSRTEGFGREVKRRILLGVYTLSEGYVDEYFEQACRIRRLIIDGFNGAFADVDVIATPTTPSTAFERGQRTGPLGAYSADVFTIPASLAGLPAISVPLGRDDDGLAFGLQLVADNFAEPMLFAAARSIEQKLERAPAKGVGR